MRRRYQALLFVFSLLLLVFFASNSFALLPKKALESSASQENAPSEAVQEQPVLKVLGPPDDYDRGVPRTSVIGFFEAGKNGDYERAAKFLDLRSLPRGNREVSGPKLARQLKVVLDRTLWIDPDLLSDNPQGHQDDGLPPHQDLLGQIETKKKIFTLLLQNVRREDGVYIWKISTRTVAEIPELYEQLGLGRLGEYLSSVLPEVEIMGIMLWQWVAFISLVTFCYGVVFLMTWLAGSLLIRHGTETTVQVADFIRGPIRLLLWVLLVRFLVELVSPTMALQAIMRAGTLLVIALTWCVIRLSDFFFAHQATKFVNSGRPGAVALIGPLKILTRLVIVIVALLIWFDNLGYKITTIIAGLGVGSIAVALAAQRTFEEMIGAAILFTSQPIRIGDFGRFGPTLGTVEEIGLRSTRIRTLDNTMITISNSDFSRMPIENFAMREKVWYHPRIKLPYDTKLDKVREIIDRIETFLQSHSRIEADTARIRFTEIGSDSFHLDIFAYVLEQDYALYLKIAEELNLAILEIVEDIGARMALPSQTLHLEPEAGWGMGESKKNEA